MSNPAPTILTAVGVFQAQFGVPPDKGDPKISCENWQRLCDELLAEQARLRAELEKERIERICRDFKLEQSMEEVYAKVDRETSMDQLIANIEQDAENCA